MVVTYGWVSLLHSSYNGFSGMATKLCWALLDSYCGFGIIEELSCWVLLDPYCGFGIIVVLYSLNSSYT